MFKNVLEVGGPSVQSMLRDQFTGRNSDNLYLY